MSCRPWTTFAIVCLLSASVPYSLAANSNFLEGPRWRLLWHDEFDGKVIDRTKWTVFPEVKRSAGLWAPENVGLDGSGHIVFQASLRGDKIVGAGIDTYRTFTTTGGFFTFRCRLPIQPGYRPAIWLTSESVKLFGGEGVDGTEIDIMEQPSRNGRIQMALHWDGYGENHKTVRAHASVSGSIADWHTYSVWWQKGRYIFYVDGQEVWNTRAGGVSRAQQFIRMGIETPWPPEQFDRKEFDDGDTFVCDYARVYEENEQ